MHKPDSLQELIHTLSKSEKRYFKVTVGGSSEGNSRKYVQLFDLLASMESFDQEKIATSMGWKSFKEKYPMAKKYLEAKILKCLTDYSEKRTSAGRLKIMIREIEVLFTRELDQHALHKIRKAKLLAYRAEEYIPLLDILRVERRILVKNNYSVFSEADLISLNEEIQYVVKGLRLREDVYNLHYRFFGVHNTLKEKDNDAKSERIESVMGDLLALNAPAHPYFFPKATHHNVLNQYYLQKGEFAAALGEVESIVAMFNQRPEMKKEFPTSYLSALHNQANRGLLAHRSTKVVEALLALQGFSCRNPRHERQRRGSYILVGMGLILNSGQVKENTQFLELVKRQPNNSDLVFSHRFLLNLKLFLAITHFVERDYSASLSYIHEILQDKTHKSIRSYKRMVPILELVVHFEIGNFDLLEYRVRNCLEKTTDQDAFLFETKFLRYLEQLIKGREIPQVSVQFLESLQSLKANPVETIAFTLFDFETWVEANRDRCTYQEKLWENWKMEGGVDIRIQPTL